jgi:hypothetical protein
MDISFSSQGQVIRKKAPEVISGGYNNQIKHLQLHFLRIFFNQFFGSGRFIFLQMAMNLGFPNNGSKI